MAGALTEGLEMPDAKDALCHGSVPGPPTCWPSLSEAASQGKLWAPSPSWRPCWLHETWQAT